MASTRIKTPVRGEITNTLEEEAELHEAAHQLPVCLGHVGLGVDEEPLSPGAGLRACKGGTGGGRNRRASFVPFGQYGKPSGREIGLPGNNFRPCKRLAQHGFGARGENISRSAK